MAPKRFFEEDELRPEPRNQAAPGSRQLQRQLDADRPAARRLGAVEPLGDDDDEQPETD
jgi:hypothetical protein